ncbi:MAG TPA: tyrosine-protein phosphatase [Chloroflexota bacterium]|nr:tyrosine-protein phosphatase [Chloroflexota bacterium]
MPQPRHIELPGCFNLRDVGGYPTRGGANVVWNRLYRSGELSSVSPSVADHLVREYGILQVIDLRAAEEIGASRCSLPGPGRQVNMPLFTSFRSHWVRPADQRPEATASRYLEMLEQGLPSIGRILSFLVEIPCRPTLIHCAAGRDRTGIVIAFLLDLLEVTEEAIAADYALSDGIIEDGARAHAETIYHLFELLRRKHTSTRDLLMTSGVSSTRIVQLHDLLLERASGE